MKESIQKIWKHLKITINLTSKNKITHFYGNIQLFYSFLLLSTHFFCICIILSANDRSLPMEPASDDVRP